ncbi:MAG: hypothetical protein NVS2B16_33230 [Chloroflexota bacterium]
MGQYVLVAEDDPDILALVLEVLEDAGYDVGTTMGDRTLDAVQRRRPDVVLLDYQMPGMDGVEIAQELRADPITHGIPIIAMTAANRAAVVCHEMDANGCLGKPFDIDLLVATVNRLGHHTH